MPKTTSFSELSPISVRVDGEAEAVIGAVSREFSANEVIWEFFDGHSR